MNPIFWSWRLHFSYCVRLLFVGLLVMYIFIIQGSHIFLKSEVVILWLEYTEYIKNNEKGLTVTFGTDFREEIRVNLVFCYSQVLGSRNSGSVSNWNCTQGLGKGQTPRVLLRIKGWKHLIAGRAYFRELTSAPLLTELWGKMTFNLCFILFYLCIFPQEFKPLKRKSVMYQDSERGPGSLGFHSWEGLPFAAQVHKTGWSWGGQLFNGNHATIRKIAKARQQQNKHPLPSWKS